VRAMQHREGEDALNNREQGTSAGVLLRR
jgi:hypothetical protein